MYVNKVSHQKLELCLPAQDSLLAPLWEGDDTARSFTIGAAAPCPLAPAPLKPTL